MAERVAVEGADSIARGLGATVRDVRNIDDDAREVAERLRTQAARAAPKRTGRLAASGRVTRSGSASLVTFGSSAIGYGPALNWGIGPRVGLRGPHNIRATYFFADAVRDNAKDYREDISDKIQESLDDIKGA